MKLGDEAKLSGDFICAIVEYSQALKFSEDPAVRLKLGEAQKALADYRANGMDDDEMTKPATPNVDLEPYISGLRFRIKLAWFPPKGNESKRVVVVFKIHRDGDITDLRIDHSSGVPVADQAALKAVEHAAPFRPLPGTKDVEDVQFTFDYIYDGGGQCTFRHF